MQGGPINKWVLCIGLCASEAGVASLSDEVQSHVQWWQRPDYCASLLYVHEVGDLLSLEKSGASLVTTPGAGDNPEKLAEYESMLKEVWQALIDPERNPHLFDPKYIVDIESQQTVLS